jgi:tetratricopeptide (TPR) repeat protein
MCAMECPECGFPLNGDEVVCPRCLTRLESQAEGLPAAFDVGAPALEPDAVPELAGEPQRARPAAVQEVLAAAGGRWSLIVTLFLAVLTVVVFAAVIASVARRNVRYYMRLAEGYDAAGRYETALGFYLRALEQDPQLAQAENGAGQCYLQLGRPSLAIAHFQAAAALEPDLLSAHRGLGIAYRDVHMWPEAEVSLRKALALDRNDLDSGRSLGYVYYQEERYDEAIEVLMAVTRDHPDDAMAQEFLGRALYAMERYDEALAPLQAAVDLDPTAEPARQYLALVEYALGRYDWALGHFQWLLAVHPDDPTWYAYAGQCLYRQGDDAGAVAYLNHALELSRADTVVTRSILYLGQTYYRQERYDQAELLFRRVLILEPHNSEAMAGLGWCYVQQDRCEDGGVALFQEALALDPYLESAQEGLQACAESE